MWTRKNTGLIVLGMFATLAFANISQAELVITGSSHPDVEIGTKLPDNTPLNIPKDVTVDILKTPENETYVLKGPFTGTLKDYKKKKACKWLDRFLGRCEGQEGRPDPVGGVRSVKMPVEKTDKETKATPEQ